MKDNYYEILEVSPKASKDVIEAVYKQLAKKYHPDLRQRVESAGDDSKMKEINLAYETLRDPLKRQQYDTFLMKHSGTGANKQGTVQQKQVIKTKLDQVQNIVTNYRRFMVLPLTLLLGTIVFVINTNTNNKSDYSPNLEQINITESSVANAEAIKHLTSPDENTSGVPENRFTLGSSQAVVKKVMGLPTSKFLYTWSYGNSLVYFDKDGRVDGWAKIDKTLKAWLGDKKKDAPPFSLGSSKVEVLKAMGTPTSVIGGTWSYGQSVVYFDDNERVRNWTEADRHLRAGQNMRDTEQE